MSTIYEIPRSKLALILKRRDRMAKRNAAHGLPVPAVRIIGEGVKEFHVRDALARLRGADTDKRTVRIATVSVEVEGFSASYGEWKIIASRNAHYIRSENETLVRIGNSPAVPEHIASRERLECDHCNARRNRTLSFVVEPVAETSPAVEVGGNCMSAFLGISLSDGALAGLSDNSFLQKELSILSSTNFLESEDDVFDEIDTVLAVAVNVIARDGFISSKEATDTRPATWTHVAEETRRYRSPHLEDGDVSVGLSDFMEAGKIVEWLKQAASAESAVEFYARAFEILSSGISSLQDIAILTALVGSHARHVERQSRMEQELIVARGSNHVGTVGVRSTFVCRVASIHPYQGQFGSCAVVNLVDEGNNLLTWFATGTPGLKEGHTYEVTGTVKKHSLAEHGGYRGAAQTLVNRVTVVHDFGMRSVDIPASEAEDSEEFDKLIGLLVPGRR